MHDPAIWGWQQHLDLGADHSHQDRAIAEPWRSGWQRLADSGVYHGKEAD